VNFLSRSPIMWVNRCCGFFQIGGRFAGQLGGPGPGRVGGDAEKVDPTGSVFHDECCIQLLECHGVDVKEVGCQQALCLGLQEGALGIVAAGRWWDAAAGQDYADGGCGNAVS
jgi:hypothetical protein